MMPGLRWSVRISVIAVIVAGVAGTSLRLRAQASDRRPISSLMPPGALLYLEANDFHQLLNAWNGSGEKRRWLGSANFSVLSVSRLIQRLSQVQGEFAAAAGVPIGMDLAGQVAGARSGFAFYNLSELTFVYMTQMPQNRIEGTDLWRGRARYQSREVAGIPFYVKSNDDGKRSVAFASYKEWFVVATGEDLMAETLALLSGRKAASLSTQSWFTEVAQQSHAVGDLRLVFNLNALLATPQFRTYWLQRNASELKPFSAGISDLFQRRDGFTEERAMLRKTESPAPLADSSLSEALVYASPASSLYRGWSMPSIAQLTDILRQVILGEQVAATVYNAPAPVVTPEAGAVGSEADLEIRIDEPPFQRSSEQPVAPLVNALIAMQPTAVLHVQATTVLRDQVFVMPDSAVVVMCKQPDRAALDQALAQLQNTAGTGSLDPLQVSVSGHAIVLSRMELAHGAANPSVAPDVTYTAMYNHRAEWPHYRKLFAILDRSAANPEMAVSPQTPPFFSGNMQSLGDSLSRLRSASITTADQSALIRETVRYELAQP